MVQQICTQFEPNTNTSSATICKWCGKEKFMHEQIIMAQQIKITQTSNADMNIGVTKKNTAVEWLFEQIGNGNITSEKTDCGYLITINNDCYEQAKQMEKEQIRNAIIWGTDIEAGLIDRNYKILVEEQYYNETYNK